MILETGKSGIEKIINNRVKSIRDELIIYPNLKVDLIAREGNVVYVGYYEDIICESEDAAINLIRKINSIISGDSK